MPGNTDDRLTAAEGRLGEVERRVASLETTVGGLTGTPFAHTDSIGEVAHVRPFPISGKT